MKKFLLAASLFLSTLVPAQNIFVAIDHYAGVPTNPCKQNHIAQNDSDNSLWVCSATTNNWVLVSGGGGGSVSISQGAGITVTPNPLLSSGTISIANGAITNAMLSNPALTVTAGGGLTGGGSVALGSSTTLAALFQSLTTSGSSGAATLSGGVLNIPQYGGGAVSSVFTRTGAVTAQSGDYTLAQITGTYAAPLQLSTNTLSIATGGIGNSLLTNSAVTVTAGGGLSGGGAVSLGGSVSLAALFQSLTTTGSSGPATLSAGVLNIPQYSGGGGGPGTGTLNASAYWSSTSVLGSVTPPTTNGDYQIIQQVRANASVAPTSVQIGLGGRAVTGAATTDTILYTDNASVITHDRAASAGVTETLPTATTLGNPAFVFSYSNKSSSSDTLSPTTWTIDGSATKTIASGTFCRIKINPNLGTDWLSDCSATAGGGGSVTSVGLLGTANQIAVAGSSPITSTGSWTLSLPTGLVLPTNTITTTTPSFGDSTTLVANTAFVQAAIPAQLTKFNASAYGATFNTQYTTVGAETSGSPTVTCSTCSFVNAASPAGDVGKEAWMMGTTSAGANQLVCPQTTISTVNSATSVTLAANCTANLSAPTTGLFIWGTNDDSALNTAWTATSAACQTLYLPQGIAIVSTAKFNSYSGCAAAGNYNQPGVHGTDKGATFLVPDPTYTFSGCTPACFMGGTYSIVGHFSVWGTGYSPAGGANKVLAENNSGFFTDMDFTGWCASCAGSTGVKFVGPGSQAQFGGSEAFGETNLSMNAATAGAQGLINFVGFGSKYGLHIVTGTTQSLNNTFGGCFDAIIVDSGAVLDSRSDTIFPQSGVASPCPSGNAGQGNGPLLINGRANFNHLVPSGFSPVIIGASGTLTTSNTAFPSTNATTTFPGSGLNIYNGSWLLETPGGSFIDQSGNTYAGIAVNAIPPTYKQNQNARVTGSGTSSAITITVNTTGDAIFVLQSWVGSSANSSGCTDTQSNTYTHYKSDTNTGSSFGTARRTSLWYTLNATSGSNTITCTISSAGTFFSVAPVEVSGQSTSTLDGAPTTLTGSGTSIGGGSAGTTATNNDLIFEFVSQDTTATYAIETTTNNGLPQTAPTVSGTGTYTLAYGPVIPSGVTYSLQGTLSANTDWVAYVVQIPSASSAVVSPVGQFNMVTPLGTATFTGGTGITSVVCASGYICNNSKGTVTIVGGTGTTGTIATVTFSATQAATPACFAYMNGGATTFGIGNNAPSTTAFGITAAVSVVGASFNVNYECRP